MQASCLSLAFCLRFLWSGFPGKMGGKRKEKVVVSSRLIAGTQWRFIPS